MSLKKQEKDSYDEATNQKIILGNFKLQIPAYFVKGSNANQYYAETGGKTAMIGVSETKVNNVSDFQDKSEDSLIHAYIKGMSVSNWNEIETADVNGMPARCIEATKTMEAENYFSDVITRSFFIYNDDSKSILTVTIGQTPNTKFSYDNDFDRVIGSVMPYREPSVSVKNAIKQGERYLSIMHFSKSGLKKQLEYEGYPSEDADEALEYIKADWNQQALGKAKDYLKSQAFSAKGLKKQLEYEGFTSDQADFGVENCEADWKEQAVKKGDSYLRTMSFSRQKLIEQLKYEGFTNEEAEFSATQNGF